MKTKLILILLILCISSSAYAIPLQLNATSTLNAAGISDFTISFSDTGDGLLQLDEITSFSGVTLTGFSGDVLNGFWSVVDAVPDIMGISTGTSRWTFSGNLTGPGTAPIGLGIGLFDFEISNVTTSVPEPATMTLLGLGLLGLGWAKRKVIK